ncbi:hypothetical protein [Fibrobacter succinogenes]|uniref:hypothetical protein n=1 Tax=Fibrobacter succinogenes TaxID=833 RepID=UPI00156A6EAD|nr:hypothetical protein [Fibrobacter succinogenes]
MPEPTYLDWSRFYDKTNNVIYLLRALGLQNAISIRLTNDVTGSVSTDLRQDVSITLTISNGAVTHAKLGDDSVQANNILDATIPLSKFATACFGNNDVASDNDGHIATHAQVVAYVTRLLQGYGQNYGTMTVAAINAMTLDNLHNGDLVIVTGISEQSPANVITLGNLTVRNGQNLIFHKQGTGAQVTGEWQSIDGEFKLIQNPVDTDNASGSGKGGPLKTLVRLQQNGNGDITATFADIPTASASGNGLMTKELYTKLDALPTNANLTLLINAKADKDADAVPGNLAVFDENGNPVDSGVAPGDLAPATDISAKEETTAAALDNLDARMRAVEEMAAAENMGDRKADSLDTQVLKIGGSDVAVELASIRNSLAGKQDSLSWMTNDEVDAMFENAWNATT